MIGYSEARMPWLILILAGVLETAWAVGLKYTDGFSRPVPTTRGLDGHRRGWHRDLRHSPVWGVRLVVSSGLCGLIIVGLVGLRFAPGSK